MIALLFLSTFSTIFAPKWTLFKDFDGKFQVEIPCSSMEQKTQTMETAIGKLEYHSFYCTPKEDNAENKVFLVSYVDYPATMLHQDSTELRQLLLQETIESSVQNVNGTLRYKDDIKNKGISGVFWRVDYNAGKAVMKTKAFIVKNRLYLVQVATTQSRSRNLEADKYLSSFTWF
jgi:hypothetical protein